MPVFVRASSCRLASVVAVLACTAPTPEPERATVDDADVPESVPQPEPSPPTPTPTPESPRCAAIERPPGSLEFVPQKLLDLPRNFDPSGKWGAALGEDACDVWMLDGEVYMGPFGGPRASGECVEWPLGEDPCETWPDFKSVELELAEPVDATIQTGDIELVVAGHLVRALVDGQERYQFSRSPESPYIGFDQSPDDTRFALVRSDAIELRELATGALLGELELDRPRPPGTKLHRYWISWSPMVALLGYCDPKRGDECNPDKSLWELRKWADIGAPVEAERIKWVWKGMSAWLGEAEVDPLGRWLFAFFTSDESLDFPSKRLQIPLTAEAGAGWLDGEDVHAQPQLGEGHWIGGSRTARWWKNSEYIGDVDGHEHFELSWSGFQLWPTPLRTGPHELARDPEEPEEHFDVFGVGERASVLEWSHCWDPEYPLGQELQESLDDLDEDGCHGQRLLPSGCSARGISHELDWLLAACEPDDDTAEQTSWRLIPVGEAARSREIVELANAEDGTVTAVFGRSGLALAGARGTKLLAPDGQPRTQLADYVEILPATLGPEIDRAIARGPEGLAVLDLASAEVIAKIPASTIGAAITHAAFAPDGRRLAWSDSRRITVWDIEAGVVAASWDANSVLGLAWRQDGAVLLSGSHRPLPEHAWDPTTGQYAHSEKPDEAFLDRLARADLDPSWRWAFEGDYVILRIIDSLPLYLESRGRIITETGLYDGDPEHSWVRVVGQPGVFALDSLPARLHHPNLLADFLAGKPLPAPILDAAELER